MDHFTDTELSVLQKRALLKTLRGSVKDPSFVVPEDLPSGLDSPRRYDLFDIPPRH